MILVRGTVAVGGKLTPRIWPSVVFFGFLAVAILYSQAPHTRSPDQDHGGIPHHTHP